MKKLWCWRCQTEIPMLNEDEFAVASNLYSDSFRKAGASKIKRFKPLLDYYEEMTGSKETEPNAIMHHRISQYGPACTNCGKPYRTPQATLCPACGNKRKENT
jgi:DNA-directed RNA polymerase subunit RPC12/RpoP